MSNTFNSLSTKDVSKHPELILKKTKDVSKLSAMLRLLINAVYRLQAIKVSAIVASVFFRYI